MKRSKSSKPAMTLLALLTLLGWSGEGIAEDAVIKSKSVAPPVPSQTRLAHLQMGQITVIAARKGWLQEEFAKVNAKFDLVDTSAFTQATSATLFDRGDLHIIRAMFNFALQYPAMGFDTAIIWGSTKVDRHRAQTVVLKDSPIKTVEELKGHTLAASVLSCPFYASIEALRTHGVTVDNDFGKGDMRFMNITGAAATSAFLAGRFEGFALHPTTNTTAPLFVKGEVRTLTTAIPDGVYVNSGGRSMEFAQRKWVNENPDLVKAYLVAHDRVVRWLAEGNGKNFDEAATIVAREMRIPKSSAMFSLKDKSQTAWEFGETNPDELIKGLRQYQEYQIANKDPLYVKKHVPDKQIDKLVDRRFFIGGAYFVDSGERKTGGPTQGSLEKGKGEPAGTQVALGKSGQP
jgi:sulfonate transport system substrate-binding protein